MWAEVRRQGTLTGLLQRLKMAAAEHTELLGVSLDKSVATDFPYDGICNALLLFLLFINLMYLNPGNMEVCPSSDISVT